MWIHEEGHTLNYITFGDTKGGNLHFVQMQNNIFWPIRKLNCLVTRTCKVWFNLLSHICRSTGRHSKYSAETFIFCVVTILACLLRLSVYYLFVRGMSRDVTWFICNSKFYCFVILWIFYQSWSYAADNCPLKIKINFGYYIEGLCYM